MFGEQHELDERYIDFEAALMVEADDHLVDAVNKRS
jgi:hypothetical protein